MPIDVAVLAESDSYLKWAVGTAAAIDGLGTVTVSLVRSPSSPSAAQCAAALTGTRWAGVPVTTVGARRFARQVALARPDVVLLACTGPTSTVVQRALARSAFRPVLVAGIPGIGLPARTKAWTTRAGIDLFLVHSHREEVEYARARELAGATGRIGLASLPYLRPVVPADLRTDVVFATQAKVPATREQREAVLLALASLARARPDLTVVVKTRGAAGEFHTHHESLHYGDLWQRLVARGEVTDPPLDPALLTFAGGAMSDHLARAAGFVTVSSTAALEAMASDVPLLLIDEFGVGPEQINECFVGSGALAGLAAVATGDFRRPDDAWRAANYFHDPRQNTWTDELDELLRAARAGELPTLAERLAAIRTDLLDRRRLLRRGVDRLRLTGVGSALARRRLQAKRRVMS